MHKEIYLMEFTSHPARRVASAFLFAASIVLLSFDSLAQSNVNVRVMAANLNGNSQKYEPFALRIFQGLKPDVVAIQEFNYTSTNGVDANNPAAIREMVDTAFGTNFTYFRESSSFQIPNGIISRYPIITNASWPDVVQSQPNRGFAWAQIDLPGTNDLYIVSVHLLTSGDRAAETSNLKALMQANFPASAWIVVAGDFNASPRTEASVANFNGYLTDFPIPVDQSGNSFTSANRNTPHDYVLPSLTLTNFETPTVLPSQSFPSGLVFDSRVYNPLSDVAPVQQADSGLAQHMAVMKDFLIPVSGTTNPPTSNAPSITIQPLSQTVSPGSNVTFTVTANGTAPLAYQWFFNNTNITGATTNFYIVTNAQLTNAGNYSVTVTNIAGSITSSNAVLIVTNTPPSITTQPQSQTVSVGQSATFSVTATGTLPLNYQWQLGGTNLSGATTNPFTFANAQLTNEGNYSVVITNLAGSVTSSVAMLTVNLNTSTSSATNVVISQIYGGGGNASASYQNDFVELFNPTASAVTISTWSVQYASSSGTSWTPVNLTGTIQPYHYYLVKLASGGAVGSLLPAADATGGINMSAAQGKVALANSQTALSGSNPIGTATVVDFVGFGSANAFEGSAAAPGAPAGNNATSILRKNGGLTDSKDNANDFTTATPPAPRNSVSSANPPSTPATNAILSAAVFSAGQFQMFVTGTAGSNYVVQVTTNLAPANWVPKSTNASPFTFTDTNLTAPHKFYRAVSPP